MKAFEQDGIEGKWLARRGQYSKRCFYETLATAAGETPAQTAAAGFAEYVARKIKQVYTAIPVDALQQGGVPILAAAFLAPQNDATPMRYTATLQGSGGALPVWLHLDGAAGVLSADATAPEMVNVHVNVCFVMPEGIAHKQPFLVSSDAGRKWTLMTNDIVATMREQKISPRVRKVLSEMLEEVYHFDKRQPKDVTIGGWLAVMRMFHRALLSAGSSYVEAQPEADGPVEQRDPDWDANGHSGNKSGYSWNSGNPSWKGHSY